MLTCDLRLCATQLEDSLRRNGAPVFAFWAAMCSRQASGFRRSLCGVTGRDQRDQRGLWYCSACRLLGLCFVFWGSCLLMCVARATQLLWSSWANGIKLGLWILTAKRAASFRSVLTLCKDGREYSRLHYTFPLRTESTGALPLKLSMNICRTGPDFERCLLLQRLPP